MQTINGKLITQEQNQLDTLKQKTQSMIQHCQNLESQITTIGQQQNTKYFQEINTVKSQIQKLDKRLIYLEQTVSQKFRQFLLINVFGLLGIIGLWFWFEINHQPTYQENKAQGNAKSVKVYRHSIY